MDSTIDVNPLGDGEIWIHEKYPELRFRRNAHIDIPEAMNTIVSFGYDEILVAANPLGKFGEFRRSLCNFEFPEKENERLFGLGRFALYTAHQKALCDTELSWPFIAKLAQTFLKFGDSCLAQHPLSPDCSLDLIAPPR